MLRQLAKRTVIRVLGAGGYSIINSAALDEIRKTIADTNARVTALQNQVALREKIRETTPLTDVPLRLDKAGARYAERGVREQREDYRGLASHYASCANSVSRYGFGLQGTQPNAFADDDLSLEYSISHGVYVPGNEVDVDPQAPSLPWRHLFADPECGVFLCLGQSNAGNHGDTPYAARREVYCLDFLRMRCFAASDPLPGSSGTGGSVWSRLGDLLIENGVFQRVLFVPLAFGGTFITDWIPGGSMHRRTALALGRLRRELNSTLLSFSAVLWQQGEAEANHAEITSDAYRLHFYDIVADLREQGVFAPMFVTQSTICEAGLHPFQNHRAIREAQSALPDASGGIFAGPDTDVIGPDGRYDGCHFSARGLEQCSRLWSEVLASQRPLMDKL
jgi:hypothetical protein